MPGISRHGSCLALLNRVRPCGGCALTPASAAVWAAPTASTLAAPPPTCQTPEFGRPSIEAYR
eukprot:3279365-Alexandrium_andersonii.AAC.1